VFLSNNSRILKIEKNAFRLISHEEMAAWWSLLYYWKLMVFIWMQTLFIDGLHLMLPTKEVTMMWLIDSWNKRASFKMLKISLTGPRLIFLPAKEVMVMWFVNLWHLSVLIQIQKMIVDGNCCIWLQTEFIWGWWIDFYKWRVLIWMQTTLLDATHFISPALNVNRAWSFDY
jgi:hypothetical protein